MQHLFLGLLAYVYLLGDFPAALFNLLLHILDLLLNLLQVAFIFLVYFNVKLGRRKELYVHITTLCFLLELRREASAAGRVQRATEKPHAAIGRLKLFVELVTLQSLLHHHLGEVQL